jgi:hypothetical protein
MSCQFGRWEEVKTCPACACIWHVSLHAYRLVFCLCFLFRRAWISTCFSQSFRFNTQTFQTINAAFGFCKFFFNFHLFRGNRTILQKVEIHKKTILLVVSRHRLSSSTFRFRPHETTFNYIKMIKYLSKLSQDATNLHALRQKIKPSDWLLQCLNFFRA